MQFIYELLGLPIDQAKFLVCEFIALLIGFFFRSKLRPCPANVVKRQLVSIVIGLALGFHCFSVEFWHIVAVSYITYLILVVFPRNFSHLIVFTFVMAYVSFVHLYYQYYHYAEKRFDLTSPMMIFAQKLTYVAFSFHDGIRQTESLTVFQKAYALKFEAFLDEATKPKSVIVGPSYLYQDYQDFITGENITKHKKNNPESKINYNELNIDRVVLFKCIRVILMIAIFLKVCVHFPITANLDEDMLNQALWYRFLYFYVSGNSRRLYYYTAWTLSDAVHNAAGFGFNGFDERGEAKWDLLNNVNILELEKSTNIKNIIDNWHITTSKWLRFIAFERLPKGKTLGVFVLSAFWHGFYPGYYITFIMGACLVYIGRGIRRNIRPIFLKNKYAFIFYDVVCWVVNQFSINYITVSFFFLDVTTSVKFFNSWYWCVHIAVVVLALALPRNSFKSKPIN